MLNFPQSFEPVGSDSILEQFVQLKDYVKQFEQIISSNENVKTIPQTLTEQQKAQARENIGAGTGSGSQINVIDNLSSSSSVDALSANQGRILNEKIANTDSSVSSNLLQFQYELDNAKGDIDEMQGVIDELQGDVSQLNQDSARVLKTPMTAPNLTELVGINSNNSQVGISVGHGINIENGVINANGLEYVGYYSADGNVSVDIDLGKYDYFAFVRINTSSSTDVNFGIFPNTSFTIYTNDKTASSTFNYCYLFYAKSFSTSLYITNDGTTRVFVSDRGVTLAYTNSKPTTLTTYSSGTVTVSNIILYRRKK